MSKNLNRRKLPLPNVSYRATGQTSEFTAAEVRGMVSNPVYAGFGPFPSLIPDEEWVAAATVAIEHEGAEQYLVNLLYMLRESFKSV